MRNLKNELEKYEEKYALLIKERIQEEINKINSEIEISIHSNDIDRIYVIYKEFQFEFTYVLLDAKIIGNCVSVAMEKLIPVVILMIDIQEKSRKERERSYDYVRSILKSILEDSLD